MKKQESIKKAISIIEKWEGFKTFSYKCPAGKWTIGYGITIYPNGQIVKSGDKITQDLAEKYLMNWCEEIFDGINNSVKTKINDNQMGALISLTYNIGLGNFLKSTMLKLINKSKFVEASNEFDKWVYAAGKILDGLVKRRKEEKELFLQ